MTAVMNLEETKKTSIVNNRRRIADTKEKELHSKIQTSLEEAILSYQKSIKSGNTSAINSAYVKVCSIYPPLNFVRPWFKKYRYLYDTREDFIQDYLRIFCTSLVAWQPRCDRKESRYNGSGEYKNFFWGALSHNFINLVKSESSGKRNLSSKCPLCEDWCNPLSTHLIQCHVDLLWEQLETFGLNIDTMTNCPFCKSHKIPRAITCNHKPVGACEKCLFEAENKAVRKHLLSAHSTYLFERFRDIYPEHVTLAPKVSSVHIPTEDSSDEISLYDNTPSHSPLNYLLSTELSKVQKTIITKVLNGARDINYDAQLYKCSRDEFDEELDSLRTTMTLCGMSGGVNEDD